ncbi:hypothetical protein MFRU_075g00030 [Monilinia fructicola]|uniref:WW domain-containing protein n=1 Tax=Monilinia fructicola TaxID=38448 RepID=A0A5M9JT16_MONFR|nr:hypothetical protein EYC84_000545 [Monilinia fructicola]KAG4024981.1 hypothetical protein MFRU_075g00030 [Monilinia fructicola]
MIDATISNPEWWEQRECCDGTKFYYNVATHQRTKLNPSLGSLPPGWLECNLDGEIQAVQQRTGIIAKADPRCYEPDHEKRVAATIHEWTTHRASPLYSMPTAHSVLRIIWRDVETHLPAFRRDLEKYKNLGTRATSNAKLIESLDNNLQAIETWRAMAEKQVEKLENNAAASGKNTNVRGLRRYFDGFRNAVDAAAQEMRDGWLKIEDNMYLLEALEVFFSLLRGTT